MSNMEGKAALTLARKNAADLGNITKQVNLNILNIDSGLKQWYSVLSKIRTNTNNICDISFIGDSITEGYESEPIINKGDYSTYITNGYVGRVRKYFADKYGDVGNGLISVFYPSSLPYWQYDTGWRSGGIICGIASQSMYTDIPNSVATLSFSGNGIVIIMGRKDYTGQVKFIIDNGIPIIYDTNSNVLITDKYTISGLENGIHTLKVIGGDNLNQYKALHLIGAYSLKESNGIRVHNCGKYGSIISQHSGDGVLPSEIDIFSPKLSVLAFGANDYGVQTNLVDFETEFLKIVQRAKTFGDVLIYACGIRSEIYPISQLSYIDIMKRVALNNNCAFIDLVRIWGNDYLIDKLELGASVHPNIYGHQNMADILVKVLDPFK